MKTMSPTGLLLTAIMLLSGAIVSASGEGTTAIPRPEHPRPDLQRDNWLTLNGEWQFEIDKAADGESRGLTRGKDLAGKIIVPFCPESKLSGLGLGNSEKLKDVWYRRLFTLPAPMKDKRVRMHFGGVDYQAWVYINGQLAGAHVGGSAAFAFDISGLLKKDGPNEVVVKVHDDMWSGLQPRGKQSPDNSNGCIYTRTTGIWQSVWLEAVGASFVENLLVTPDPDHARALITAKINGTGSEPLTLKVEAFAKGKLVGSDTATGPWQQTLVLNLTEKRLWEPGSPFLYDLKVTLSSGNTIIDTLKSYFGLRKITIDGRKILINGKPFFQRLILDQGFYPEGLWTAPSDAALKKDIEMSLACGYNGARLHQKVFEPRFLYWADKLGYMVWGEYPDWGYEFRPESYPAVVNEWIEILLRDRNHPSIVGWCPFNEEDQRAKEISQMVWNVTKAVDPTRPALETSGWTHTLPNPEVLDGHDYEGSPGVLRNRWMERLSAIPEDLPAPPRYGNRPAPAPSRIIPYMVSEIGGVAWETQGGWGYGEEPKKLEEFYTRYQGTIDAMLDNPHLFGFTYTQLTDVEQERNGLYFYDNRKPKFDVARLRAITSRQAAYERNNPAIAKSAAPQPKPVWKVLVGAVQDGDLSTPYAYATEKPADNWAGESFDDRAWKTGRAPFGHGPQNVRTDWTTPDIYLRKKFEYDGTTLKHGAVVISYDEDTEIYVNGRKILSLCGYITYYQLTSVTDALKKALKKGSNTIAVHTHQAVGGQYIDLALLVEN
jgi:beta-galactosidase/beta-glucuronidase